MVDKVYLEDWVNASERAKGIISEGKNKKNCKLEFPSILFSEFYLLWCEVVEKKGIKKRKTKRSALLTQKPTFLSNENIKIPNYSMHDGIDVATFYTCSRRNFHRLDHLITGFLMRSSECLYTSETIVKSFTSTLHKNQSVTSPEKSWIIMPCHLSWKQGTLMYS